MRNIWCVVVCARRLLDATLWFLSMAQIVTVSVGQQAGHVTTHVYNAAESCFDYSGASRSAVVPEVAFHAVVANNRVLFRPRAMFVDLRGGFGGWNRLEYVGGKPEPPTEGEVIETDAKVAKSEYQSALDRGEEPPRLSSTTARYWTDYARTVADPRAFHTLDRWQYDPSQAHGSLRSGGDSTRFQDFAVGEAEWKDAGVEAVEETLHAYLERCDRVQGFYLTTEVDGAWGGYSLELVALLRDEVPRGAILTAAIHTPNLQPLLRQAAPPNLSSTQFLARIRSTLALTEFSSLYLPVASPRALPATARWESSALVLLPLESIAVLPQQRELPVSLADIVTGVTMDSDRTFVLGVRWQAGETCLDVSLPCLAVPRCARRDHVFSRTTIVRGGGVDVEHDYPELIAAGTPRRGLVLWESPIPQAAPDTFPEGIVPKETASVTTLEVGSDATRATFRQMSRFASRALRGDDRETVVDSLETLSEHYAHGYASDSE